MAFIPGYQRWNISRRSSFKTRVRTCRITWALDLAGGDVRKVRRFSRHAKRETLLRYDDNRWDEAGAIVQLLGEDSA